MLESQRVELGGVDRSVIKEACGCVECDFTGYSGRKVVGEFFEINDMVKELIKEKKNDFEIREYMKGKGMVFISDKLKEMVLSGKTSYEEAIRVGLLDR